jgi:hypothetical protein
MDQITIWTASRYGSPDTLGSYQRKSRCVLQRLRALHRKFERLTVVGPTGTAALPDDLSGLEELIESHAFSSAHADDYLALGPEGRLVSESLNRIGFSLAYCSTEERSNSIVPPEQGGVDLTLQGSSAAVESSASASLKLPADAGPDMRSTPTIRAILSLLIKEWQSAVGGVVLRQYQQAVRGTDRASYAGQWLFYLPFPGLGKCLPPDIRHEPFTNGILIETTPHIPNADNPSDIAAGKRVRDVLDEFGLVNDATYAIEGWPPDDDEALYEQFISGAPPGRKYTVHCVNFDGYDPDRKALLYAKLFRRLRRHPKEWGLRGWDGPVLNEAKRQVRAAAKAGGVPIEWHIGLEEPAHAVRQLLADHTNITDQQLRVIYTPLEEAHNWRQT